MADDMLEVTREELHKLIRDNVNQRPLMTENMRIKCVQLQSLFEKKKKLSSDLLKIFESVSKCEATVRQLYAKLGWEYEEIEDNNFNDIASNTEAAGYDSDATDDSVNYPNPTNSDDELPLEMPESPSPKALPPELFPPGRELKVVLTRLKMDLRPRRSAASTAAPTAAPTASKRAISDDEVSNADSDYNPSPVSSDSDFSPGSAKSDKQKKKKFSKTVKPVKVEMPVKHVPPAIKSEPVASTSSSKEAPRTVPKVKTEVKAETKPHAVSETKPSDIPLKLGMKVLARRKQLRWESGQISEILEKEDGTKKYKVTFDDKGKALVSGHHIACDAMPKLTNLAVGGRVVSKASADHDHFCPGILGELPSRKNHMRFLIFFDDQKTLYVALPIVRAVSVQLDDPLDDIRDDTHRSFMKEYLARMPYPPHTQFRLNQKVNVERDGVLEASTVSLLDCALMEVIYERDGEKEWIYRGSIRLEHIQNMKEPSKK